MAEPLKNLIHPGLVTEMADYLAAQSGAFDRKAFLGAALNGLEDLELMQRSMLVRDALIETLPDDYCEAAKLLGDSLPNDGKDGLRGWSLLPVNQFIALKGLGDFDISLALLKKLTPHFTAEFGIRPFIHNDQPRALATISKWTDDGNHHVRRLASEGTRPRLPWAMRLPALINDPQPILPLLTALIDDPEEYVRRSVANSLNDIAKDHPDLVADFVGRHIEDAPAYRKRLLKHASRTLLKQGHSQALANFGFAAAKVSADFILSTPEVAFGSQAAFRLTVGNLSGSPQNLMIDYAVHHRKANGLLTPKVFKWTSLVLAPGETATLEKNHPIRPITTRVYYPGTHRIEVQINGRPVAAADFMLTMPDG